MDIQRAEQSDVAGMKACMVGFQNRFTPSELIPDALVAVENGVILGFVASRGDQILALYTLGTVRGRGVGSELLDREEGRIRARNRSGIRLIVDPANPRALTYYLSRGYALSAATTATAIWVEKSL